MILDGLPVSYIRQHMELLIEKRTMVCTSMYQLKRYVFSVEIRYLEGKLEGERQTTLGFVDLKRDDFIDKDRNHSIYFTKDWVFLPGVIMYMYVVK